MLRQPIYMCYNSVPRLGINWSIPFHTSQQSCRVFFHGGTVNPESASFQSLSIQKKRIDINRAVENFSSSFCVLQCFPLQTIDHEYHHLLPDIWW